MSHVGTRIYLIYVVLFINYQRFCLKLGFKMKKRIGELEEFEFEPLTQGRSLHVTVAVSGWLNDKHTGRSVRPSYDARLKRSLFVCEYFLVATFQILLIQ